MTQLKICKSPLCAFGMMIHRFRYTDTQPYTNSYLNKVAFDFDIRQNLILLFVRIGNDYKSIQFLVQFVRDGPTENRHPKPDKLEHTQIQSELGNAV